MRLLHSGYKLLLKTSTKGQKKNKKKSFIFYFSALLVNKMTNYPFQASQDISFYRMKNDY